MHTYILNGILSMWAGNAPSSAKDHLNQISTPGTRSSFEFVVRDVRETAQTLPACAVVLGCPQEVKGKSLLLKRT